MTDLIPCEVCGLRVPFAEFGAHSVQHAGGRARGAIVDVDLDLLECPSRAVVFQRKLFDGAIDLEANGDVVDADGTPSGSSGPSDAGRVAPGGKRRRTDSAATLVHRRMCGGSLPPLEYSSHSQTCGPCLIPCDICGDLFLPEEYGAHVQEHEERRAQSLAGQEAQTWAETCGPHLVPCEICNDLLLPEEYDSHLQEHEQRRAQSLAKEEARLRTSKTPAAIATCIVELLRTLATHNWEGHESAGHGSRPEGEEARGSSCVANFDLALRFSMKAIEFREAFGSRDPHLAEPKIVYHWTPRQNFRAIIDSNLRVPDGKSVFHKTDRGLYGSGIYTSPDFNYGRNYACLDGACFACLSLPGRQHPSTRPQDTGRKHCRRGFHSHVSACRQNMEWVFFDSDQLLPCYLLGAGESSEYRDSVLEVLSQAMLELSRRLT